MDRLSKEQVLHIAGLANIALSEKEVEIFSVQLSDTLNYVESLKELETENIPPTFQTTGLKNVSREDEIKPSLTQEEALLNTKSSYKGYFKVKAIFQ